jgi:anti-anti-sigma factor
LTMVARLVPACDVAGPGSRWLNRQAPTRRNFCHVWCNQIACWRVMVGGGTTNAGGIRSFSGLRGTGYAMEIRTDGPRLVLSGDFDVRSTMEVRNALYEHLAGHDDVVVDLTRVDVVDLTALKVLAVATRAASRSGHRLTLRGCGPSVRRMLHLTHLIRVVEVERDAVPA